MRKDILTRKAEVERWVEENRSKAYMCMQLACKPSTLETYLKKFNIIYLGNRGSKGKTSPNKKSAVEYMKNSFVTSSKLRKKLIEDGLKPDKCEKCGLNEWLGQKIPLELHHKDGNRFNNDITNLEINCPNCHSLTPNHSKNILGS
jgi:hypothetical protein